MDWNLSGANMLCVLCVCGGIHIEENRSGCILAPFLHLSPTIHKQTKEANANTNGIQIQIQIKI